mgnify:CR=1 FL=1
MKQAEITKEIQQKYLARPDDCPFCDNAGGEGLHAHNNDIEPDVDYLYRNVTCRDCGREWVEQFRLELIDNLLEPTT